MLSRVADSLYWMSRYMERTDGILRMLKINYASSQDDISKFTWRPVLQVFSYLDEDQIEMMNKSSKAVLKYMVVDKDNPNSVMTMITKSRENARSVQDHITKDLWQCLNEFYHLMRDEKLYRSLMVEDPVTVLDTLIKQGLLYYGTTEVTMARGESLCFMNIGKYLERAIQTIDILDVKFRDLSADLETPMDTTSWKYFLQSISGYELYLRSYRSGFEARNILDQTLFNVNFPRSLQYSLILMQRYFERLKNQQSLSSHEEVNFMIGKLKSRIQYSNLQTIADVGLHTFLNEINRDLYAIGNALSQKYFAYS
ncbi:MAG TPA: alpha-E domain-containing protein [Cyclobacteriaceae bacterium]|nr:alpha-E domain-containing protein [Cyclobacteriaceae bacterium]